MANEEKELYKFVNDPKYRSKVIAKIHKNSDNAYNKRIKKIEHERDALSRIVTMPIISGSRRLNMREMHCLKRELAKLRVLPMTDGKAWLADQLGSIGQKEKYRSIIQRSYFRAFGVRK